jgi:DNA-binding GntR family transcriptional regulator
MKSKPKISLTEQVYQKMLNALSDNRFSPGSKLSEAKIATQMNVSRGPVREALRRLTQCGVLTFKPNVGCFVRTINEQEACELLEIRKRIECLAMEMALGRFDMNKLVPLRQEFLTYKDSDFPDNFENYLAADATFHDLVIEAANGPTITDILSKINTKLRILVWRGRLYGKARFRESRQEHIDILTAIIDGKNSEAVDLLKAHIDNTKKEFFKHEHKTFDHSKKGDMTHL